MFKKNSKDLEEFRECLRKNIEDLQKYGVASQYEDYLDEPEHEELPRMLRISGHDFYKGEREFKEYEPEFTRRESSPHSSAENVDMSGIFGKDDGKQKVDHVTVVGSAGAGKSTLLTRFARNAINQKIPQMQKADQMVHLINCRQFSAQRHISVAQFLFENMRFRPSEKRSKLVSSG